MQKIYLDNNATTALDPRVLDVVIHELKDHFGNPSSVHFYGKAARARLTKARDAIAHHFNVKPREVFFTSGGTEALNMVIRGVTAEYPGHIVSSSVEHSAVYETLKALEKEGKPVMFLSPGSYGAITSGQVLSALQPDTKLIVLMAANNETGVKTDIHSIAEIAEKRGIPFIVDGVALLGKELFTLPKGVSAICFSGHKIHAPTGVGFAIIRQSLKWQPLLRGGDQEFGRRGGTENLPAIMGLAEAIRLLNKELPSASVKIKELRDRFEKQLMERLPWISINGQGERLVNTSNVSFGEVDGEALLALLDMEGIAVSHGSACASGAMEPSRILINMGLPLKRVRSSIRFSLSRFTTDAEIDQALEIIVRVSQSLTHSR